MRWMMVGTIVGIFLFPATGSAGGIKPGYREYILALHVSAPPAFVFVVDEQGRRTGADVTQVLHEDGGGSSVQEIPHSVAMGVYIAPEDGQPPIPQRTPWEIRIFDGGTQTYRLCMLGMAVGVTKPRVNLHCPPWSVGGELKTGKQFSFLVRPGLMREVLVSVDVEGRTLATRAVVSATSLLVSLDIACELGMVSSTGICQSLRAKVEAAAAASGRGRMNAARGSWRAFLAELRAQGGKHVNEPALTILREEAEALLNPPAAMPKPKKKPKAPGAAKPAK